MRKWKEKSGDGTEVLENCEVPAGKAHWNNWAVEMERTITWGCEIVKVEQKTSSENDEEWGIVGERERRGRSGEGKYSKIIFI